MVKGRHGKRQTRLHQFFHQTLATRGCTKLTSAQSVHRMVLHQVVVLVGLVACLASGEETTIASTSAEPFWLGKDCVRNEDGERRHHLRHTSGLWMKKSKMLGQIQKVKYHFCMFVSNTRYCKGCRW